MLLPPIKVRTVIHVKVIWLIADCRSTFMLIDLIDSRVLLLICM